MKCLVFQLPVIKCSASVFRCSVIECLMSFFGIWVLMIYCALNNNTFKLFLTEHMFDITKFIRSQGPLDGVLQEPLWPRDPPSGSPRLCVTKHHPFIDVLIFQSSHRQVTDLWGTFGWQIFYDAKFMNSPRFF